MFSEGVEQTHLAQGLCAAEFQMMLFNEPWMREVMPIFPKGITVKSSDERTIYWLINQVAPIIARLIRTDRSGLLRAAITEALYPKAEVQQGNTTQEPRQLRGRFKEKKDGDL